MSEIFYQEQTRLAVDNFSISGTGMPAGFIHALGALKLACAKANLELGVLDKGKANAIVQVGEAIAPRAIWTISFQSMCIRPVLAPVPT